MPDDNIPSGLNGKESASAFLSAIESGKVLKTYSGEAVFIELNEELTTAIYNHATFGYASQIAATKRLPICLKVGFQNFDSGKGCSFLHIVERGHLIDTGVHRIFSGTTQAEILTTLLKKTLVDINALNENIALAWAPFEHALVFAVRTTYPLLPYANLLYTFYLDGDSRLVLGTMYTINEFTFKQIKNGSPRYIPIKEQPVRRIQKKVETTKEQTEIKETSNENNSSLTQVTNGPTYSAVPKILANTTAEEEQDEFLNSSSYAGAVIENVLEENAQTAEVILTNNHFYLQINQTLELGIETIKNFIEERKTKYKDGSFLLEKIDEHIAHINKNSKNLNFNIFENYNNTIEYINESIQKYSDLFAKSFAAASKKVLSITNKASNMIKIFEAKSSLQEQKLVIEKTKCLQSYLSENQNLGLSIINIKKELDKKLSLLGCEYFVPLCHFLTTANSKKLRVDQYRSHFQLVRKLYKDRQRLEPVCKAAGKSELFDKFIQLTQEFTKKYADVLREIVNNNSNNQPS